jgi:hypothetical protein
LRFIRRATQCSSARHPWAWTGKKTIMTTTTDGRIETIAGYLLVVGVPCADVGR